MKWGIQNEIELNLERLVPMSVFGVAYDSLGITKKAIEYYQ